VALSSFVPLVREEYPGCAAVIGDRSEAELLLAPLYMSISAFAVALVCDSPHWAHPLASAAACGSLFLRSVRRRRAESLPAEREAPGRFKGE